MSSSGGNPPAEARDSGVSPWTAASIFVLSLLYQVPILDRWFNFMDEGHMVQFAEMAANGHQLYRDVTFYPLPGAFWLLALVFEVFEPSVILTRWLVALQFSGFVTLLYVLLRRIVGWPAAAFGVAGMLLYRIWAFPHWQIYSYSTTCLLLVVVCLLLLLRFFDTGEVKRLGIAGFVFGLAVLAKQDYSAAFMLAAVPMLFVWNGTAPPSRRLTTGALLGWFYGPAAVVGAATGLYFGVQGILPDLLRFTVFNHFTGMSTYEYTAFPAFFPLVHDVVDADPDAWLTWLQDPRLRTRVAIADYMPGIVFTTDWGEIRSHPLFLHTPIYDLFIKLFYYVPPVAILAAMVSLWRRRSALRAPLGDAGRRAFLAECGIAGVGAGLLLLVWSNKPQDYLHLAVLYWPLILLAVAHFARLARDRRAVAVVLGLVLIVPAFVGVAYSVRLVDQLRKTHDTWVEVERAGYYVQPYEAVMLEGLVAYVEERTEPGDRVAAVPYFPILNFLTERLGPHRSAYILWPFPEIEDRDRKVIEAMEATQTDVVIWHFTQFDSFPYVWEYAPEFFDYLVDHFVIDHVFSY
ncbi:MAG: glycosyltransferase family 39 protein, partial [Actinomycetota bacterium]|nr:glycosyltransferase family 39 protein [Actinomycetota bacterium]